MTIAGAYAPTSVSRLSVSFALISIMVAAVTACERAPGDRTETTTVHTAAYSVCAAKRGALYCWGSNSDNILGIPGSPLDDVLEPTRVPVSGQVRAAAMGYANMCAVTDEHDILCWGSNTVGQLGNGEYVAVGADPNVTPSFPARPSGLDGRVDSVAIGGATICARTTDGRIYCWGSGSHGELANGSFGSSLTPVEVTGIGISKHLDVGGKTACSISEDSKVYCWGGDFRTDESRSQNSLPVEIAELEGSKSLSLDAGSDSGCAINRDDNTVCWGNNYSGAVSPDREIKSAPISLVAPNLKFRVVKTDSSHVCGIDMSASLYCWGDNRERQTNPNAVDYISPDDPQLVDLGQPVTSVAVSVQMTCATLIDETVTCWGKNNSYTISSALSKREVLPPTVQDIQ